MVNKDANFLSNPADVCRQVRSHFWESLFQDNPRCYLLAWPFETYITSFLNRSFLLHFGFWHIWFKTVWLQWRSVVRFLFSSVDVTSGHFSLSWCAHFLLSKRNVLHWTIWAWYTKQCLEKGVRQTVYDFGVQPGGVRLVFRLSYSDWIEKKKTHPTFNLQFVTELTTGKINNVTEKIKLAQIDLHALHFQSIRSTRTIYYLMIVLCWLN